MPATDGTALIKSGPETGARFSVSWCQLDSDERGRSKNADSSDRPS